MTFVDLGELVDVCRATLMSSRHDSIRVAAAVSTTSGAIHTGVQVRSTTCSHCSVCAEPVAVGAALAGGNGGFDACVAMRLDGAPRILSPCGGCREILRDHGFRRVIVAENDNSFITVTPDELQPWS